MLRLVPDHSAARRVVLETQSGVTRLAIERGQRKTIGRRDDTADIAVDEVTLSRLHFVIDFTGDHAVIEDAASTSGTFVDHKRVVRVALLGGETVLAGRLIFNVRYET